MTRKFYEEELHNEIYATVLSRTVDSLFEKRLMGRGKSQYFVLMMYNWEDEYLSIQVKNLLSRKFYKTVIGLKINNSSRTKRAMDELHHHSENLLQKLKILDGCIVFFDELEKQGSFDSLYQYLTQFL